jgi:ribosomal protein S18 acetylase RimI-like enzyme
MSRLDTVQWRGEGLRVGPWRGDRGIAYVAPAAGRAASAAVVAECLRQLGEQGYRSVLTCALGPAEQVGFRDHGFIVHEHLHLLRHPLDRPIPAPARRTRRARRRDTQPALAVDHAAFDPFWRFDVAGLEDARHATPVSRWRVVDDGGVAGYAVTGRAGSIGYLQRLAVRPDRQRRGIGSALVVDGLRWAQRRSATSVLVNTQEHNEAALALYLELGFVLERDGLDVLERPLTDSGLVA